MSETEGLNGRLTRHAKYESAKTNTRRKQPGLPLLHRVVEVDRKVVFEYPAKDEL